MNIKPIFEPYESITLKDYMIKCGVKDVDEYLEAQYVEPLEHYDNIFESAQTILNAVKAKKKIYVLHDSDFDGLGTTLVQYIFLKRLNPTIDTEVLFHNKNPKAHGLQDEEIVEILKNKEAGLLWIGDAGSNDTDEDKLLSELGYTIVISDHHEESRTNPYALIVNNQFSDNVENKQLSGCGVTFKLCQAIDKLNGTEYARDLISIVHMTNVSDSCGFTNPEQNTFRYWGLQMLYPTLVPFIETFNYQGGLNNRDFSFGIVSRFNAVIRVGTLEEKKRLFYALADGTYLDDTIKICKSCKTNQDKTRDVLLENNITVELDSNIVVAKLDTQTPLTGLIANKLMSKYNKPVFLVSEYDGVVSGSCRSTISIREICEQSHLFLYTLGHNEAFGISWLKEDEEQIYSWIASLTLSEPNIATLGSWTIKSLPRSLFAEFGQNKSLYGQGIKEPLIHIHDIIVNPNDISVLGNGRTLKLVKDGIEIMWFMITNANKELLLQDKSYKLQLVGTMGINEWNEERKPQIIVDEFEIEPYEMSLDSIF